MKNFGRISIYETEILSREIKYDDEVDHKTDDIMSIIPRIYAKNRLMQYSL